MKKALILFFLLGLMLLTACGGAAPAETPAPTVTPQPPVTEELRLTVTRADGYGCAFTLENPGERPYSPLPFSDAGDCYALLRRGDAGDWEPVELIRQPLETGAAALGPGESWTWAWDWSYACGVQGPGEYCLQATGTLGRGTQAERVLIRGSFTIGEEASEGPGPLMFRNIPLWLNGSLFSRELNGSGHRWKQVFTPDREGWAAETDFSLYRVTKEGELTYVPPEYNLPAYLNRTVLLHAGETVSFAVELAARYGELERGSYVLRRRLVYLTEEEREAGGLPGGSFRLLPEERIVYADAEFYLYKLRDVPQGVDPMDELRDCDDLNSTVLVSTAGSRYSSIGCTLKLKNAVVNQWYDVSYESDYYYLYFSHKLEWYPAAHVRYGAHGLSWITLAPGETRELNIDFTAYFGELAPGSYRLVIACQALTYDEELEDPQGFITVFFRILEDGSGVPEEAGEVKRLRGTYVNGGLWDREGRMVRVKPEDPWHRRWSLEEQEDRLLLTVWQDRDLELAAALLGDYGFVDILRGEDPALRPSPVTEENLGSRGALSVAPHTVQAFGPTQPPVAWQYSFTFAREGSGLQTMQVDLHFHVEVLEGGRWLTMTTTLEYPPPTFQMFEFVHEIQGQPGETVTLLASGFQLLLLSNVYGEFCPEKEYRVVLQMWEDPLNKEYYTCPLPLWD